MTISNAAMPQGSALPDIQTWGEPKVKTEKPDVDLKSMSPLSTYGRDEEYIMNKLWLDGISSLILYGVGDGMIVWCALQKRIPIMCLYDKELHKKTIEAFLLGKIIKKMEEATPKDTRWYRTAAQLGCRDGEDDSDGARAKAAAAKAAAAVKTAAAKAAAAAKAKNKRPNEVSPEGGESSEDDSSSTSKKKPKKEV
jgi:hypothetical protein